MKRIGTLTALGMLALMAVLAISVTGASGLPGEPSSNELLCGTVAMPANSATHGKSPIDHPSWMSVTGMEYPYSGQNCDSPGSSNGTFTWHVQHDSVNTQTASERGTEHGAFMDTANGMSPGNFNGQITDWDFGGTADPCGNRNRFYASGQHFDNCGQPNGQGNFNTTQAGNSTSTHFRGQYGTLVYQEGSMGSCPNGGSTFCFEAILVRGH